MISVCIIMKNEEKYIDECLKRAASLKWELVVVDTGSMDRSKEIALKYTDKVFDFEWIKDFSAARNFASQKASNDIIFALDSDEFIEEADAKAIEKSIIKNKDSILCPLRINKFIRDNQEIKQHERISRIYYKSVYYYEGKIHEQLVRYDGKNSSHIEAPMTMIHVGYEGTLEQRIQKAQRNADLLLIELEEKGEDPYIRYQLGKSYYMQQKLDKAIPEFEKCLDLNPNLHLEYVFNNIESYCYCLINTKQFKKALEVLNRYDGIYNDNADFEFLAGHILMNNGMLSDSVIRFLKATNCKNFTVEGINSYSAYYNIAVIFECANQKEAAIEYYEKCGDYKPALEGLKRLLGH